MRIFSPVSSSRQIVAIAVLGSLSALVLGTLSALYYWLGFGPPPRDPTNFTKSYLLAGSAIICLLGSVGCILWLRFRAGREGAENSHPADPTPEDPYGGDAT